jgi:exonuclease III
MNVVVSWNVAGRVRRVAEQAAALGELDADVVALQEIRATALASWRSELRSLGYEHVLASDPPGTSPERRLGVLIAARVPLERAPSPAGLPWPERHLAAVVDDAYELHDLHAPISSKAGRAKVVTLEVVHAHLAAPSALPRVLVGDLNTPQYESRDGEVRTFARTRTGNLRAAFDERHDLAELALVTGLREHGYADAFRAVHGYEARDRSWAYPSLPERAGYRIDHVIVRGIEVEACEYVHAWRRDGLSDHSGMWARLRQPSADAS